MKQFTFILSFILINFSFLNAQTVADALRYTAYEYGSTGRAIGTANSFAGLGTDASLIGSNPAGLASFRKSEFTVTPGYDFINTSSTLNGTNDPASKETESKMSFGNISYVVARLPRSRNWKTFNFALGYNRLATFRETSFAEGTNTGSILERWNELAEGFFPSELNDYESGLAYDAFALINFNDAVGDPTNEYSNDYTFNSGGVTPIDKFQQREITGGMSEFSISLGANYRDKLYFGGLIGIPFVNYQETRTYSENDNGDQIPVYDNAQFVENIATAGAGINLKFGAIYRLSQQLRFGLAVHTPTRIALEDTWSNSIIYNFTDPGFASQPEQLSPEGIFSYSLKIPGRLIANAGYLINKTGFLSAEIELVDYAGANFNFEEDPQFQDELNRDIDNAYKNAVNFRLGGEYAYRKLRARAGIALLGSPGDGINGAINYHAGVGLRTRSFFMDLGYKLGTSTNDLVLYETRDFGSQTATSDLTRHIMVLTFGFKL